MEIADRINLIIREKNLSIRAFSKSIGFADTTIGNIISAKSEPGFKVLYAICKEYDDISPDWLITGKGEMIKNSSLDKLEDPPFVPYDIYKDSLEHVKELMQMLKQSQRQLDDLIELHKENQKITDKGNGAHPDNDAKCADAG